MTRPLLEPHDYQRGTTRQPLTTTTLAGDAGAGTAQQPDTGHPNPIDALFAGSRWRRDDVIILLAALNLLIVLAQLWTVMRLK